MRAAPLVCLITPGHLASAPRVIKEADALVGAGYRVHVVAGRHFAPVEPLDATILATAKWSHTRVNFRGGSAVLVRKVLRRLARALVVHPSLATLRVAARAHHAEALRFASAAARIPADFFLGHCLAGLPVAALAAAVRSVPCGFDAEDLHDAETEDAAGQPADRAATHALQSRLLSRCTHLTASAPLIGEELHRRYAVQPATVLNVFPLAHAPREPVDPGRIDTTAPARIYWFSQTIGPGRGLEAVVAVLGRMRVPVELQLRGFATREYREQLDAAAHRAGLARPIIFLPPGPPAEMARLAAASHLGLSIEESRPLNRDLCLTNKIFVYLLAGIPQLLTPTAAQRALAPELGDAALVADLTAPESAAQRLDAFFADPGRVAAARREAWNLARRRYCWDVEQQNFLNALRHAFRHD